MTTTEPPSKPRSKRARKPKTPKKRKRSKPIAKPKRRVSRSAKPTVRLPEYARAGARGSFVGLVATFVAAARRSGWAADRVKQFRTALLTSGSREAALKLGGRHFTVVGA